MKSAIGSVDRSLLVVTLLLVAIGVVMVYSSSVALATIRFQGDSSYFLRQHLVRVLLGLLGLGAFMRFNYTALKRLAIPGLLFSILTLALLFIPGLGTSIRGATRALGWGRFHFQPAELAKLTLVIYLAEALSRKQDRIRDLRRGLIPFLVVISLVAGLIMAQPDYSTALTLTLIAALLLFVGGARLVHLVSIVLLALPFVYMALLHSEHSRSRMLAFLDRGADPLGTNYQVQQSLISLGAGGLWGIGLGQSRQKLLFLPDPHTDFVFAIIGEELGLIGTSVILILFFIFAWRGLLIARRAPDLFGFLLGFGLTALVCVYALVNMAVATALLPVTGLPLPFISYGGSALVLMLISTGILLSISRRSRSKQVSKRNLHLLP